MPADAPRGICPECLLKAGLGTQPEPGATTVPAEPPAPPRELPRPGERFGGYLIVRELGRGGMGAVFEAEQLESGRRVALKVLSHQLDSPEARKRFLREGRLAASINHPNSVYVYGTDEVEGTPVIAMELIAGGTLQQRVQAAGPLPVAEAVDAILHLIAGLEAAQALGILHRDIKPSNCFQDTDGTVKIGDFGLSISTAARGDSNVTVQGALLGTPAFASPEQLRGEELNARSDMYSVGGTLFYLLTGHTPFEAPNMVQLIANVLEQPAPSPRKFRPAIPSALAKVVLRCLEKQPGERFRSYDELRQALAPFSSTVTTPATLGVRFAAGALDMFIVGIMGMMLSLAAFGELLPVPFTGSGRVAHMVPLVLSAFLVVILYYSLLEGIWGASLGKWICRLRVAGPDRNPPGVPKALVRTLLFQIIPVLPYWLSFGLDPTRLIAASGLTTQYTLSALYYLLVGLLFCTARRRNGYAGLHDLATGTRVIRRLAHQVRPALPPVPEAAPATDATATVGPYHVLETLQHGPSGEWLLGYDPRLLRKVWVHRLPPGAAPVAPSLRNLGRPGRLRWIAGRRTTEETWDAFEGVTGKPLLPLASKPQPWGQVRFWLLDLARELQAAEKDGTLPPVLDLDRVWITADGRAKLLDFPAPGLDLHWRTQGADTPADAPPIIGRRLSSQEFLSQVAGAALEGKSSGAAEVPALPPRRPLPLAAREFLVKLRTFPGMEALLAALQPLMLQVAAVSRLRRAGLIAGCAVFPLLAGLGMLFSTALMRKWERQQPGLWELSQVLTSRAGMRMPWVPQKDMPEDRVFAIYVASQYRSVITNTPAWTSLYAVSMIQGANRQFAERSVAEHPAPTEQDVREATAKLKPMLASLNNFSLTRQRWVPLLAVSAAWILYVGIPALIAALAFKGGLVLRALRLAVVRADGQPASRLRVFWRSVVAWAPLLLAPVLYAMLVPLSGPSWAAVPVVLLLVGLALWSLLLPERSLQDRIARTCLVPR
jgi:hypothetical protein